MVDQSAIYLLEKIVAVAVILWFFAGPWQSFWVDFSKRKCFDLQTQMIEAATSGRVKYSDPVYKMLWQRLEYHIQSKYTFSLSDLVAALIVFGRKPRESTPLDKAISEVKDSRMQMELMHIYKRSTEVQILQAVTRSPALPLLIALALPLLVALAPVVVLITYLGTWTRMSRHFAVDLAHFADDVYTMAQHTPSSSALSS